MNKLKILFVDDDVKYSLLLKRFLEREGYEVIHVADGQEALDTYVSFHPDLILLDVNMPKVDGFEVARRIRMKDKQVILFFISDRTEKTDRLRGFSLRGNDYIPKPFYPEELIARIKERFPEGEREEELYEVGDFRFLPSQNKIVQQGKERIITSRQASILRLLFRSKNDTVSRTRLLTEVWGDDSYANSLALNVQISYLRKTLKGSSRVRIVSVKKKGYVLETVD